MYLVLCYRKAFSGAVKMQKKSMSSTFLQKRRLTLLSPLFGTSFPEKKWKSPFSKWSLMSSNQSSAGEKISRLWWIIPNPWLKSFRWFESLVGTTLLNLAPIKCSPYLKGQCWSSNCLPLSLLKLYTLYICPVFIYLLTSLYPFFLPWK